MPDNGSAATAFGSSAKRSLDARGSGGETRQPAARRLNWGSRSRVRATTSVFSVDQTPDAEGTNRQPPVMQQEIQPHRHQSGRKGASPAASVPMRARRPRDQIGHCEWCQRATMIIFLGAAEFYSGNLWVGTVFLTAVD